MGKFETTGEIASFGGKLLKLKHDSSTIGREMALNLYLPPQAVKGTKVPLLIYLAGLTCTGDNGAEKGFFQSEASNLGIAVAYPDTSPRGTGYAGEDESFRKLIRIDDFGTGAGFYIDATEEPWSKSFKMYSYITQELESSLCDQYPLDKSKISITGHSMGGHGALTLFLRNPGKYKSVSAFAPIANPTKCPWGEKAFKGYFGESNKDKWKEHDATELVKQWKGDFNVLIDVGTGDNFYKDKQLLPENFVEAAKSAGNDKGVQLRFQDDYDHSYFFISTFSSDHIKYHAKYLNA